VERHDLEALVDAGLTVRQIAARTGKGYSTIRYWLAKHGLATLHRGPGRASRHTGGERVCARHGRVGFVVEVTGSVARSADRSASPPAGGV
jgi:hypothetical protein